MKVRLRTGLLLVVWLALAGGCGAEGVCPTGASGDPCRVTADAGDAPDVPVAPDIATTDGLVLDTSLPDDAATDVADASAPDVLPDVQDDLAADAADTAAPDDSETNEDTTEDTLDAAGDASDPDATTDADAEDAADGVDDVAEPDAADTNTGEDAVGEDASADQAHRSNHPGEAPRALDALEAGDAAAGLGGVA